MKKLEQVGTTAEELQAELTAAVAKKARLTRANGRIQVALNYWDGVIDHRRGLLKNIHRSTLAPVTVTFYSRNDDGRIDERKDTSYNTLEEALTEVDFNMFDYNDMGVDCSFEEDSFSASFSMNYNLLSEFVAEGKVVFFASGYWNNLRDYVSPIVESPTHFVALQYFQQSIYTTDDHHHIFLDDVHPADEETSEKIRAELGDDTVQVFKFTLGS